MAWLWLLAAGVVEVIWTQSIKPTDGFTKPLPTAVCFVLGVSAVYLLSRAMQGLPVGVAYCVFTGMGGVGAAVLGVLWSGDRLSALSLTGLAVVIAGLLMVRMGEE